MSEASIYLLEIGAHNGTSAITLRVSAGGYVTKGSDTPADTFYPDAIIDPGYFSRSIFSEGKTLGDAQTDYGEVVISNAAGYFDDWINYGFDGRPVVLKKLKKDSSAYNAAELIMRATATRLDSSSAWREYRLKLYDRRLELDRPLQRNRYLGTTVTAGNTAEGTANMKGKAKPICFGTCRNVPAVMVNPFNLIYQVSDGLVASIVVFDGGIPLTPTANYATLPLLNAATIPPGKYGTCLARGLFRLGGTPAKVVTANVLEGATSAQRNAASIATRMLTKMGLTGAANIATASFTTLAGIAPAELGLFVNDEGSALGYFSQVLGSIGGYILPNVNGAFEVGRAPVIGTPVWSVDEHSMQGIPGLLVNPDTEDGLPAYRIILRYLPNWTKQDNNALGECVTEDDRTFLANTYREVKAETLAVRTKHPLAPELTIDTLIISPAVAQLEANRRLALYNTRRDLLTFPVWREDAKPMLLGSTGTVTMPRFGYQAGRPMVVIGRREDPAAELVHMTVWG